MLNDLIKHSLRSFKSQKSYILINIIGLSIGIACSLLIALYILSEVTYDRFNVRRDRIYNIVTNIKLGYTRSGTEAISPARLGPEILTEFPEVEDFLRMKRKQNSFWERETMRKIVANWKEFTSYEPLQYAFVDDIMKQQYIKERQNAIIAVISSILAIFIAALGLYGLTSHYVEHHTKEIGVRKALGSTVPGICFLISRDIIILVAISVLFSFPVIYYVSGKWLDNFYYRISPDIFTFLGGLFIAMLIALLTISYHTFKAANTNPANSLKYE